MPIKTKLFDVAEHLANEDDQAFLIADALETGDAAFIRSTLNTVARARGMSQIAREAGVTREALYRALAPDGDPRMSTLMGVFEALGVKLSAVRGDTARRGQKHSITAVFDTRSHADQAMAQLKSSGVPASDITMLPASGEAVSSSDVGDGGGKGFWGSLEQLFGGTEDRATYAESIRRGGVMLSVRAEDDRLDQVINILEQHGSVDLDEREETWRSEGWTGAPATYSSSAGAMAATAGGAMGMALAGKTAPTRVAETETVVDRTPVVAQAPVAKASMPVASQPLPAAERGGKDTVQVVEERLDVGKRAVSRGKVRLHSYVVEREVAEDVTLRDETVSIDRHAVDRPVAALGEDAFRERTIEMEEVDEAVVVAKTARVVEEIGIRKDVSDRVEIVNETLRKTVVDIDDARTGGTVTGTLGRFADEIRDSMEVVGSDGAHVGTVDHLDGGRIKLKKADIAAGGEHHYLTHDMVQSVAGKVMLAVTAAEAKSRWATA